MTEWSGTWTLESKRHYRSIDSAEMLETRWNTGVFNYSYTNDSESKYSKTYFVDYFARPVRAEMHQRLKEVQDMKDAAKIEAAHTHKSGDDSFHAFNTAPIQNFYNLTTIYLGHGKYGAIVKAEHLHTKESVAVKTIAKNRVQSMDAITVEAVILQRLDHPNICKLVDTFQDFKNIYMVVELCGGQLLLEAIVTRPEAHKWIPSEKLNTVIFTEESCAAVMGQIFSAVQYMHERQIMHRDIRPENVMLWNPGPVQDNAVKLTGFGTAAKCSEDSYLKTKVGAPLYVSPQVIMGWYNTEADVWSCGVMMHLLLCGFVPFYGVNDAEILTKIFKAEYDLDIPEFEFVSRGAKQLIAWCLTKDPYNRCTAAQAQGHAWCTGDAPPAEVQPGPEESSSLIDRLTTFREQESSKKMALDIMVQALEEKHIRMLHERFTFLDEERSGLLTEHEVNIILYEEGYDDALPELQILMQEVAAKDENGMINYSEFLAQIIDKKLYTQEDLCWLAFRDHDKKNTGNIPLDKISQILTKPYDIGVSQRVADLVMKQMKNFRMTDAGACVISFMEFLGVVRAVTLEEVGMSPASPGSPTRKVSKKKASKAEPESPTSAKSESGPSSKKDHHHHHRKHHHHHHHDKQKDGKKDTSREHSPSNKHRTLSFDQESDKHSSREHSPSSSPHKSHDHSHSPAEPDAEASNNEDHKNKKNKKDKKDNSEDLTADEKSPKKEKHHKHREDKGDTPKDELRAALRGALWGEKTQKPEEPQEPQEPAKPKEIVDPMHAIRCALHVSHNSKKDKSKAEKK